MAVALPYRLRVLKALTQIVGAVTPANGFSFDLGDKVFRGRDLFGDSDPLPMASILEVPVPPDELAVPDNTSYAYSDWDLLIQVFVEDDYQNPTDPAHILMAEVKQVLMRERKKRDNILIQDEDPFDLTSNGVSTILDIRVGQGVVRPPDEGVSDKAYGVLKVTLRIIEDLDDPFA